EPGSDWAIFADEVKAGRTNAAWQKVLIEVEARKGAKPNVGAIPPKEVELKKLGAIPPVAGPIIVNNAIVPAVVIPRKKNDEELKVPEGKPLSNPKVVKGRNKGSSVVQIKTDTNGSPQDVVWESYYVKKISNPDDAMYGQIFEKLVNNFINAEPGSDWAIFADEVKAGRTNAAWQKVLIEVEARKEVIIPDKNNLFGYFRLFEETVVFASMRERYISLTELAGNAKKRGGIYFIDFRGLYAGRGGLTLNYAPTTINQLPVYYKLFYQLDETADRILIEGSAPNNGRGADKMESNSRENEGIFSVVFP
ncbi:MAG: hypothetical protein HQL27_05740, partial [Candidatus Omnitrophica bacterium]|nr:hypothetical protein [Candidatus Omnitrophota bacterium]